MALQLLNSTTIADFQALPEDRKSTRLNSSHDQISYAVFCLKKKKQRECHESRHAIVSDQQRNSHGHADTRRDQFYLEPGLLCAQNVPSGRADGCACDVCSCS